MASVYVHLSGRNTDEALLKVHGKVIIKEESEMKFLDPKECSRCKTINEPTNKFCKLCGNILDEKIREEIIKKDV